jgi:hypothetical protein
LNKILNTCAFVIVFVVNNLFAQIDLPFVSHLGKSNLEREHLCYLKSLNETDSVCYQFAKYYLQYPDDSLFFIYFKKSSDQFLIDSNAVNFASIQFTQNSKSSFCLKQKAEIPRITQQLSIIQSSIINPKEFDFNLLPEKLQVDFQKYQKISAKKPIVALSLSAVIPGLGKLYIGSKKSFALTLLSMTVLGLQSYESYHSKGIAHPLTIVNLGFFTTYYAVNLLGSYRETKLKKKEIKTQYLINATNYYHYKYRPSLY